MAKGVNKVILVGNLGNDPEFNQTASGLQVAKCSIATSKTWNDNQGQRQERTEWHRVVFFNRLAEIVSQYLKKGAQIYVEGELRTNKWEKDGVTRYTTEVVASEMQMLGSRQGDGGSPPAYDDNQYSQDSASGGAGKDDKAAGGGDDKKPSHDDMDQDIPF